MVDCRSSSWPSEHTLCLGNKLFMCMLARLPVVLAATAADVALDCERVSFVRLASSRSPVWRWSDDGARSRWRARGGRLRGAVVLWHRKRRGLLAVVASVMHAVAADRICRCRPVSRRHRTGRERWYGDLPAGVTVFAH